MGRIMSTCTSTRKTLMNRTKGQRLLTKEQITCMIRGNQFELPYNKANVHERMTEALGLRWTREDTAQLQGGKDPGLQAAVILEKQLSKRFQVLKVSNSFAHPHCTGSTSS